MGAVEDVIADMRFEEKLKKLSELSIAEKTELWEKMKIPYMDIKDLRRIFGVTDDYD